jgi:imidazoleglycerol-phosphate dehydratase
MIVERQTTETRVRVVIDLVPGPSTVATGLPFLDHMMRTLARYAGWTLDLRAVGDLRHHIIEDVALTLGGALTQSRAANLARYAHRVVPMDDALVEATLDVGGRPYYRGPLPSTLYDHWMRSFCDVLDCTLHIRVVRGHDRHHIVEAAFKALGFALRDALEPLDETFSTKGAVKFGADASGSD